MNSMKDAFSEAIRKRGERAPTLNIKIEVEKEEEENKNLAPSKLEPESPHEDKAMDEQLIDEKLAQAGVINDNDAAEEMQEEQGDPEIVALLEKRGEGATRPPRSLGERAAAEYAAKKKKA